MPQPAKSKSSSSREKSKEPVYTQEEVRKLVQEAMKTVSLEAVEAAMGGMGPNDVQIIYGMRLIGKDGEDIVTPIKGFYSVPDFLSFGHAPSIPGKVNRVISEMILAPVIGRVVELLQKRNNMMPPLPSSEASMEGSPYDVDVIPPPL